jgi:hypothetical protein
MDLYGCVGFRNNKHTQVGLARHVSRSLRSNEEETAYEYQT